MIIATPHLSGLAVSLLIVTSVIGLGTLLESRDWLPSSAAQKRIVTALIVAVFILSISQIIHAAIDYDTRIYCSWAWWDFIVCW